MGYGLGTVLTIDIKMNKTDRSFTYVLVFEYKSEDPRDHSIEDGNASVSFHNPQVISLDISGKRDYFLPDIIHTNIICINVDAIF